MRKNFSKIFLKNYLNFQKIKFFDFSEKLKNHVFEILKKTLCFENPGFKKGFASVPQISNSP